MNANGPSAVATAAGGPLTVTDEQRRLLRIYTPARSMLRGFADYRIGIYKAMREKDPGLPVCEDEARALAIAERQDAFLKTIPAGTIEGEFVAQYYEAAFSYQQGLGSSGRHLKSRNEKAAQRRQMDLDRRLISNSSVGLFKGAVSLISVSGLGVFLSLTLYSAFGRGTEVNQVYLALTCGFSALALFIGFLMNRAGHTLSEIDSEWHRQTSAAELSQALTHQAHQRIAFATGDAGWKTLFDEPPDDADIRLAVVGLVQLNVDLNKPGATPSLTWEDTILRIRGILRAIFKGKRAEPAPIVATSPPAVPAVGV